MPVKANKHVHFMHDVSATPSPSFSTSTLPSSPGALTPPQLGFGSPHQRSLLPGPQPTPGGVFIHRALAPKAPLIAFDLTQSTSYIKPLSSTLPHTLFSEPATNPRVPYMEIQCLLLPYKIVVQPGDPSRGYITLGDLLHTIHSSLRTVVLPNEIAAQNPQVVGVVERAWRLRYKALGDDEYTREKERGPRRVDFLGEYKVFNGLQMNSQDGTRWMLHVTNGLAPTGSP